MSKRRRYLLTYDIADDKRRSEVFALCRQNGDHTQYSVFVLELNDRELIALQAQLEAAIHQHEDQVLIADLGLAEHDSGKIIARLGKPYDPPVRALVI